MLLSPWNHAVCLGCWCLSFGSGTKHPAHPAQDQVQVAFASTLTAFQCQFWSFVWHFKSKHHYLKSLNFWKLLSSRESKILVASKTLNHLPHITYPARCFFLSTARCSCEGHVSAAGCRPTWLISVLHGCLELCMCLNKIKKTHKDTHINSWHQSLWHPFQGVHIYI